MSSRYHPTPTMFDTMAKLGGCLFMVCVLIAAVVAAVFFGPVLWVLLMPVGAS